MRWSDPFGASLGRAAIRVVARHRARHRRDRLLRAHRDWHPQHATRVGRSSPFGERIAHGMLVLSLAVGLVPSTPSACSAAARRATSCSSAPCTSTRYSGIGEIHRARPDRRRSGLVDFAWQIRNQDGALSRARASRCCGAAATRSPRAKRAQTAGSGADTRAGVLV